MTMTEETYDLYNYPNTGKLDKFDGPYILDDPSNENPVGFFRLELPTFIDDDIIMSSSSSADGLSPSSARRLGARQCALECCPGRREHAGRRHARARLRRPRGGRRPRGRRPVRLGRDGGRRAAPAPAASSSPRLRRLLGREEVRPSLEDECD